MDKETELSHTVILQCIILILLFSLFIAPLEFLDISFTVKIQPRNIQTQLNKAFSLIIPLKLDDDYFSAEIFQATENNTDSNALKIYLPLIYRAPNTPLDFNKKSPTSGSTGNSLAPTLSWNQTAPVTCYEYCYDTSNDGTCTNWISAGTNTYAGLSGLQEGTTYYWQVRSWNGTTGPTYANGSAVNYWNFLTVPPAGGFWIYPNYIIYEDYGYGHFIGEILNNTTQSAELIRININLWDSFGNFVGTGYDYVSLWLLSAGEKTCFDIWFESPENLAYLTIDSITYWETGDDRLNISSSYVSGSYNGDYYRIIGFLTNNEYFSVKANVVDTIYSTTGYVAACSVSYVDPILAPGATNAFDDNYITIPMELIVNNFRVQTDGYESQSLNRDDPETLPLEFHDPTIYWLTDLSSE